MKRVPNTRAWRVSARGRHAYARRWWRVPLVWWRVMLHPQWYIPN